MDDYNHLLVKWAHTYNGYQRLAGSPQDLHTVIEPLQTAYQRDRSIPDWAGVDLLRGWAFYLARSNRHTGYEPLIEEFPEIFDIVAAINSHPAAHSSDRAPSPPGDVRRDRSRA